ncbi:hypothetical protein FB451DRAFT_1561621 [Mycena latifolia]|nr:hypothetical protein FB451DRAFT_1561621 [Mycena latifolia]
MSATYLTHCPCLLHIPALCLVWGLPLLTVMSINGPGPPQAPYLPPHLRDAPPAPPTPVFRSNVTTRRRSPRAPPAQCPVSPLPDDSLVITPPKKTRKKKNKTALPHRPAPQVQERAPRNKPKLAERCTTPEVTQDTGSTGDALGTRGGSGRPAERA